MIASTRDHHTRSADHITDDLACLHWLHIPEQSDYKVAVPTYKVLHGSAPRYLGPLVPVADLPGRRILRSGGTNRQMVPSVRRSTVGDQAFTDAGPRVWNILEEQISTSQTLSSFRQQLKTWLFRKSYSDIIIWTSSLLYTLQLTAKKLCYLGNPWLIDWSASLY